MKLLLLILCKNEGRICERKKNTLTSVSGVKSKQFEIAMMVLYIFIHHCSGFLTRANIDEYLKITNRKLKNKQPIRDVVHSLAQISIAYFNNNSKIVEEPLFKFSHLSCGEIYYEINTFFSSKLSCRGAGHKEIEIPYSFFKSIDYKAFSYKNKAKAISLLYLIFNQISVKKLKSFQMKKNTISTIRSMILPYINGIPNKTILESIEQYISMIE